jgi:hypothetical protein
MTQTTTARSGKVLDTGTTPGATQDGIVGNRPMLDNQANCR